jgi:glutathione synthase/RimK-type ligase-like ATP-grasp enzyme
MRVLKKSRMNIAFVTWSGLLQLSADDQLLRAELERRGVNVAAIAWDDPNAQWDRFDAIVLRSTWDYHRRIDEFRAWLAAMEAQQVSLWNPAAVVRNNIHKGYLLELEARGIDVVPTVLLRDSRELDRVLTSRGWERAVVKPAVSASAYRTHVVARGGAHPELATGEWLVQPFVEEVTTRGEWSLLFAGNEYSHAVLKRPNDGDFRVQAELGGSAVATMPPQFLIEQARALLDAIPHPLLYARVDGIERDGRLVLMELELTEPSLFLVTDPDAPSCFADAIQKVAGA